METDPVQAAEPVADTATAPVADAPEVDEFETDPSDKMYDQKYVAKLRSEAAARRTALKPFEETFSGWNADDREVWLDISRNVVSDPATALQQLQEVVKLLGGGELTPQKQVLPDDDAPDPDDAPMTRREYQAMLKQEKVQSEVQKIDAEASTLGYKKGTSDYRRLIDVAMNETKGDLAAAHAAIQKNKDDIIAAYIAAKEKGGGVTPAASGGAPPVGGGSPKNFAEARAATMRLLGGS